MKSIAVRITLKIILMLGLGSPEAAGRSDFRDHGRSSIL